MFPRSPFFSTFVTLAIFAAVCAPVCRAGGESAPSVAGAEFFEARIRPLLAEHCYECHSAEAKKLRGALRLDLREGLLKGGDTGPAIVPGDPDASLLIQAVRHGDKDTAMPPKKFLAPHEIESLSEWVKMGAPDPRTDSSFSSAAAAVDYDWPKALSHWAYQPVRDPAPPAVKNEGWVRSPIDRFILAGLEEKNLSPVGDADKRTLLRRATYDLLGLPPTPQELAAFLADASPGAFETVVDQLLASPHYGERWGRHWMDLVRYADTAGDNSDYPVPQLYLYRNYLIDAFNADKPFDTFVREQLAGDLLPARDAAQRKEQVIATGYVALSRRFGSLAERYPQHLTIEDTLDNMGHVFLGLGLSCARCHNHKFDAIPQRDYYGLYGIFESTRYAFPGIELLKVQKDFVSLLPRAEAEELLRPFSEKAEALQKKHDDLAAAFKPLLMRKKSLETDLDAAGSPGEKEGINTALAALQQEMEKARGKVKGVASAIENLQKERPAVPDAYAVQDAKAHDANLQLKGDPERPGEVVPRKFLEVLGGSKLEGAAAVATSGRLQLADWIVDGKNPLTARVLANRIWEYHFGSGLVKTPNEFGVRGMAPSHPELLDWLARRLVEDGWSFKRLHKRLLLSHAYQLASSEVAGNLAADPENRALWRFNRQRIDAESLRDTLLMLSGAMDWSPLTEPHPFPAPSKWEFTQHFPFKATYPSVRRSVYLMTTRLNALPFFQAFDGPDRNTSTAARDSSVTTVQALYFLNSDFVHEQAGLLAARLLAEAPERRLDQAFAWLFQRAPSADERERIGQAFSALREKLAASGNPQDADAWAGVARALFRTNEFLYID